MTPAFEAQPSIVSTRRLSHDNFQIWWNHLDEGDRDEFRFVFAGDELLARFVCAMDALILAGAPAEDVALLETSYFIAAMPYPAYAIAEDDPDLPRRAQAAWRHDAVQSLMERVKYRSTKRKRIKLENMVYAEAERMVRDASHSDDMADRKMALETATKLMRLADEEDAVVRAERSRRGLARARDAMAESLHDDNPRVLKATLKAIVQKLGPEAAKAIVASVRPTETVVDVTPHDG